MSKKINLALLGLIFYVCFTMFVFADELEVIVGELKGSVFSSAVDPSNLGVNANSVNLYTGQHIEKFPLVSLSGRGGLGVGIDLDYNGNVSLIAKEETKKAQASPFGLGFSMGMYSIIADHRNTADINDDNYKLIIGNESFELIETSAADTLLYSYYITEKGHPWIITRHIDTINNIVLVVGWKIIKEDGTIYRFGDFSSSLDNLNATRNIFRYGNFVGNGVTNDDEVYPIQWDLKLIHDVDSLNWVEFTYLKDTAYLEVMDSNDSLDNSANAYTRTSYTNQIMTSDSNKIVFTFSPRSDTVSYFGINNYEFFATKKVESIFTISNSGDTLSQFNFSYLYLSNNSFKKLLLDKIENKSCNGTNTLPPITFEYYTDSTSIAYGAIKNIFYSSGSVKEITYKNMGVDSIYSCLDYQIYDSTEHGDWNDFNFDVDLCVAENIFLARGNPIMAGYWDGYWHIDTFTIGSSGTFDHPGVSPDGWAAVYDQSIKQVVIKRWMGGYWKKDSVEADSLFPYNYVYIYPGKDCFVATTGSYDGHCEGNGDVSRWLRRAYYYRWDGEKWSGEELFELWEEWQWRAHYVVHRGDYFYIPADDYKQDCAEDYTTIYWGYYDHAGDSVVWGKIDNIQSWTVAGRSAYGPGYFAYHGFNNLHFFRHNGGANWTQTTYGGIDWYARSVCELPNGVAWSYDDDGYWGYIDGVFLTSDSLKRKNMLTPYNINRALRGSNHSLGVQYPNGNWNMFEWTGNGWNLEHNIYNSGNLSLAARLDLYPDYYYLSKAKRLRFYSGGGEWENDFSNVGGYRFSSSPNKYLAYVKLLVEDPEYDHYYDSLYLSIFKPFYRELFWDDDYKNFGVRFSLDSSASCDTCFSYQSKTRATLSNFFYIEYINCHNWDTLIHGHDTTIGYLKDTSWANVFAYKLIDTLFTGKPQVVVVDSILLYEYAGDTEPIIQNYSFWGGLFDKTGTTPRFTKAEVSTSYYDGDDPDGHSVTYFYNDISDSTIYDGHFDDSISLPNLKGIYQDTILLYGILNGGYWLDGKPYLTYSYSSDSGISENVDYAYYYYKLYETRDSINNVYWIHLDSTKSRQDGFTNLIHYIYDSYNGHVKETIVPHKGSDTLITKITFAFNDITDTATANAMKNDNAIIQVLDKSQYHGSYSNPELISKSGQRYEIHGCWKAVESFTWRDYDSQSDTLFTSRVTAFDSLGNVISSQDVYDIPSAAKFNRFGSDIIGIGSNCKHTDLLIQDFEQIPIDYSSAGYYWDNWYIYKSEGGVGLGCLDTSDAFTGDACYLIVEDPEQSEKNWGPWRRIYKDSLTVKIYYFSCWVKANEDVYIYSWINGSSGMYCYFDSLDETYWQKLEGVFDFSDIDFDTLSFIDIQLVMEENGTDSTKRAQFDNFRFHPLDAHVTTTVYDHSSGLVTAELGLNNIPTRYEYDEFYRLIAAKDYKEDILSRNEYYIPDLTEEHEIIAIIDAPDSGADSAMHVLSMGQAVGYRLDVRSQGTSNGGLAKVYKNSDPIDSLICNVSCNRLIKTGSFWAKLGDTIKVYAEGGEGGGLKGPDTTWSFEAEIEYEVPVYDPNDPAYVKVVTYNEDDSIISMSFYDSYGRLLQARSTNYLNDTLRALVSGAAEYDSRGRVIRAYKPYYDLIGATGIDDFTQIDSIFHEDTAYYNGVHDADCDTIPYSANVYWDDVKGRLKETAGPGPDTLWALDSGHTTTYTYSTNDSALITAICDPDSILGESVEDRWGLFSQDKTIYTDSTESTYVMTTTYKNVKGQIGSIKIENDSTSIVLRQYWYDDLGQLVKEWRIDYDTIRMIYDKTGNLRFMQNDKRADEGNFVYFKYDIFSRKIEEGLCNVLIGSDTVFTQERADSIDFPSDTLPDSIRAMMYTWSYDYDFNVDSAINYGKPVIIKDSSGYYTREFHYFPFERKDSIVVELPIADGQEKSIVHYYDDRSGQIEKLIMYPREDTLGARACDYLYDKAGRLLSIRQTGRDSIYEYDRDYITYSYLAGGQIDSILLGHYVDTAAGKDYCVQIVDYTYNPPGWLTGINDPDDVIESKTGYGPDSSHFGMTIRYTDGDNSYYNGRISSITHANSGDTNLIIRRYNYTYNELGWLTKAADSAADMNNYATNREYGYNYLGNRVWIKKGFGDRQTIEDYYYASTSGTSILDSTCQIFPRTNLVTFEYDILGNLTSVPERPIHANYYDYRNLLTKSRVNQSYPGATYNTLWLSYDEAGRRIEKAYDYYTRRWVGGGIEPDGAGGDDETDGGYGTDGGTGGHWEYQYGRSERHYLYDGNVLLAIFSNDDNVLHARINGPDGEVAVYYDNTDSKLCYSLKDQIGSVRMNVDDSGSVTHYINYHPFGHRFERWTSYPDPMKFTGKEFDVYGPFQYYYFGARYYDPELGIFSSIDKATQFPGGYNYCGNNPILCVDPDGNFFLAPFLVGAAYGALFSSAAYTAATGLGALTGDYTWTLSNYFKGLGNAALTGALGGGIGASFSMIGGQLTNELSYNMLANAVSNAATSAIMGENITASGVIGMSVGSLAAGTIMGSYTSKSKSGWLNMAIECTHSSASGAISRFLGTSFAYALDPDNPFPDLGRDLRTGAIGGFGSAFAKNAIMGYPVQPPVRVRKALETGKTVFHIKYDPVYRSGGILGLTGLHGFAGFGRDLIVNETGYRDYDNYLWVHETTHYWQQQNPSFKGWANTIGILAYERLFVNNPYSQIGRLEWQADRLSAFFGHPYPY